jgi:hypothetical protein
MSDGRPHNGWGLRLLREAVEALPPSFQRRLMVTCDGDGASHLLP